MLSTKFFLFHLNNEKNSKRVVEVIEILKNASKLVYENVKDLAGTSDAAGDFGRGAGGDISRKIDIVAEKTVLDYLKKINFECVVLGEECGRVELSNESKGFVIMDAIDGSANAVRGIPFFCCSLAFATENKISSITDGVVTDLSNGNMYWASKGKGAFLNDKQIHVQEKEPTYRIVGVNLSGAKPELLKQLQPIFKFARGLIDIFIDFRDKIRIQDMAAGFLLVKEAGGLMLDANLKPLDSDLSYQTRLSFIAASNKKILDEIISQIKK